jgi:hypothetical protein
MTKTTVVALAKQLIAGTEAKLTSVGQLTIAGKAFTPAELTTQLNRVITLRTDVDTAKATTKEKLAAEAAEMPALRALMSAMVTAIKGAHAGEPGFLAAFGINPKVRTPPTIEAKAAAAAKRASTRVARHTMGPVAKLGIKGDVTGVNLVPVSAGKPTVNPATPASPSPEAPAPAVAATPVTPAAPAPPVPPAAPVPRTTTP